MKKILAIIIYFTFSYVNLHAFCSSGTIQEVVNGIKNGNFDSAGDGWATSWIVDGGLNPSTTYDADGQYVFLWDDSTISQTISIEKNTEYQVRFLGAYSVKTNGSSDPDNDEYRGQAVSFTYSSGGSTTRNVDHWIFRSGSYYKALAPFSVDLGNSGNSTSLTIKGCAGGCAGYSDTFIKLDAFKLYKCVPDSTDPDPNDEPDPADDPVDIDITKKIKLTIYNDDVKFLAKDGTSEKLKTKIVKNSFSLTIHSVDENKNDKKNTVASDVYVRLIPSGNSCTSSSVSGITSWKSIDIVNKESALASFYSSLANKSVKVQAKWKNINGQEVVNCCSADLFAIRPDKFEVTLPSGDIKAGEKFRFQLLAKDKSGGATYVYNETKDDSFEIVYSEKKAGCNKGSLNFTKNKFSNGLFDDSDVTYNDVGELEITVREKKGSEFAVVDASDTSDSERLITSYTISKKFIPAKLDTTIDLQDAKSDITFYSQNPNTMGAKLKYTVKATTSSGSLLSNYKDGCYAKDVDLELTYTNSNSVDTHTVLSDKNITKRGSNYFQVQLSKSKFASTSQATETISLNLDRDPKIAKNPNLFTITKVKASDTDISTTNYPTSSNKAHYYYGRAHVSSPQTSDSDEMTPKVYYEVYCKGCDRSSSGFHQASGKSSEDSIYWYILPSSTVTSFGTSVCDYKSSSSDLYPIDASSISSISHQDFETIKIKASKVPSKNKIYYEPVSSFLQYNKFGTSLPKHYFDIVFTTANNKWAGEGDKGTTVDLNVSKKSNQSIDW